MISTSSTHCSRHSCCESSDTAETGSAAGSTPLALRASRSCARKVAILRRTSDVFAYTSAAVRPSAFERPAATAANFCWRPVRSDSLSELLRPFTLRAKSSLRTVWKVVVAVRSSRTSSRRCAGVRRDRSPSALAFGSRCFAAARLRASRRSQTSMTRAIASMRAASFASDPPATLARASGSKAPCTAASASGMAAMALTDGAVSSVSILTPKASRSVTSTSISTAPPGERCTVDTGSSVAMTRAPRRPTLTKRAPAAPTVERRPAITLVSAPVISWWVLAKNTFGSPATSAFSKAPLTCIDTVASDDSVRQNMITVWRTCAAPALRIALANVVCAARRFSGSGRGPVLWAPSVSITVTTCTGLLAANGWALSRIAAATRLVVASMPWVTPPRMFVIPWRGMSAASLRTCSAVSATKERAPSSNRVTTPRSKRPEPASGSTSASTPVRAWLPMDIELSRITLRTVAGFFLESSAAAAADSGRLTRRMPWWASSG
mmetsp:Transcript_15112/g.46857  ORF Transcript_15112/g.46857 Transcript_15112/m.46857 type:complete len:494 (-) Transcript_15112:153-1634(-)